MAQDVHKVIVWGDSILKGVALDPEGKYRVLEENCGKLFGDATGIEIVNRSRFGCTVTKGHSIMRADLERVSDADTAVIEFGGNDCDFDWAAIAENPEAEHSPKTPLHIFRNEVENMVKEVRARGIRPILTTLPPLEPNRFVATISKGLNRNNILKWLGCALTTYRWQESYSDAISEIARRTNCLLIDLRSAFLTDRYYEKFICADGMHPNASGHRLMAGVLKNFLRTQTN